MKTVFLTIIAVVGLAVLGGLGYLAFSHSAIPQTDFEQEIQPVAEAPAPTPTVPGSAIPAPATQAVEAAPAAAPLAIPAEAVVPSTAPVEGAAPVAIGGGSAPSEGGELDEPTTMTVVPSDTAPAETGTVPMPPEVPVTATTPATPAAGAAE